MAARVFQVSELIRQVNIDLFRYNDVAVEGEVTNFTKSAAGHCYFSIKDAKAQIRVVFFAKNARFLRFRIENGLSLIVRGRLTIYEAKGEFQLSAVTAEPAGLGALQLAFEQLKKQLAAEGLFDAARKRPIPMLPQRIAIVTSPTGAAIRDILHVLGRRYEGLALQIYPVRVQGPTAAREIATALRHLARWDIHDVILICRGGGSLEDLWPFNEEVVARAVAASTIPTISGIGHETDFTICDLVADLRAPTPSAAAEIVIRAKSDLALQIDQSRRRICHIVEGRVQNFRHELRHLVSSDGLGVFPRRIAIRRERLERSRVALYRMLEVQARSLRRRLTAATEPLNRFPARLALRDRQRYVDLMATRTAAGITARIERERRRLESMASTLNAVSPLSVLSRGYAIAFSRVRGRRKPILDSGAVGIGEPIEVQLKRGSLQCTVDAKTMGLESVWPVPVDRKS
ncbi:MAG TPA: exodeoxyribonuclease VII large subunit [Thermoanaerobaculia bacterium]|nr:exodeoxyribonuclease VII large subunit [Thermoanaerobaculia bacterium]